MKKEILTGLIVIVAIAAIAIFTVTPSMSTSFEIDGKRTSDENLYSPHNQKIDSFDPDEDTNHQVYEAGFGSGFFDWLKEWLSGWLNDAIVDVNEAFPIGDVNPEDTNPDAVLKGIDKIVEDEKAGEPGSTPVAGEVIGEYAGPKELTIDGVLSDDEKSMLEAMGVGEIVYEDGGHRYYTADGGVAPGVKHSRIAFLGDDMYFYEEGNPEVISQVKSNKLGHITFKPLGSNYPTVSCSFNNRRGCLIESEEELFKGTDFLDSSRKFEINGELSGNEIEYVVKDIRPVIREKIGGKVKIHTLGGETTLKLSDIPIIDDVVVLIN